MTTPISNKRCILYIMIAIIGSLALGCGDDGDEFTTDDISNFQQSSSLPTQDIYPSCVTRYYFTCSDGADEPERFYWIGMKDPYGFLVAHGPGVRIQPPSFVAMHIDIGYFTDLYLAHGVYNLEFILYLCRDSSYVGDEGRSISYSNSCIASVDWNYYDYGYCHSQCCTFMGRRYAQLQKENNDLTGASAVIEANYGNLCFDPDNTVAFSVTYVGVAKEGADMWGQIGVGTKRDPERFFDNYPHNIEYYEVVGYNLLPDVYFDLNVPQLGETHLYKCELDMNTGRWHMIFTDTTYITDPDSAWLTPGQFVVWSAEIFNYEDDMAGSYYDSCNITDCKIRTYGGDYQDVEIEQGDTCWSTDNSEWGIRRVNNDAINIWDKRRL